MQWKALELAGDPHLVLGRRRGQREIEALLVGLHRDLFPALRAICSRAISALANTTPRNYEPNAEIDRDAEHFVLRLDDLPEQPAPARSRIQSQREEPVDADDNPDRTAALVRSLRNPGGLEQMDTRGLAEFVALFYSIMFQQDNGEWVHFIKKVNPRQVLKRGRVWTQFGDTLHQIEDPALVLEPEVDVVLTAEILAGFGGMSIKNLFTDVHLVMRDVPIYVENIAALLGSRMSLSEAACAALATSASKKVSIATRLYRLQDRLKELDLKPDQVRRYLSAHDIDPNQLVAPDDSFTFGQDAVSAFLDILEGRYFEDDWTGEPRRADRFSTRT
jgi:hypothetical protein